MPLIFYYLVLFASILLNSKLMYQSGSVPNGTAPIPPYRAFQRVYEYLVDQLDLSEKRKDTVNSLPHEEKWKLLSNLSRESSLNLLVLSFILFILCVDRSPITI